ncbi:MAG: N-6 DNA methylase [Gemmatimonadaceae bacterium]|nr:N-6 DNA methylase [Gemmatimonadaceae bacterium]
MLSLQAAATLLASPTRAPELAAIAAAIGCGGEPLPLDAAVRKALAFAPEGGDLLVARGPGTLRALLVQLPGDAPVRDSVAALASRLHARSPQLLWIILAVQQPGCGLAIAAWSGGAVRPRVAALIADRTNIVASDAETLSALAAANGGDDVLVHARWLEVLGRESLTRRFYRALERVVGEMARLAQGDATADERRELALLYVSRLIFLSFLEAKGWLDGDRRFLERQFEERMVAGGDYHRRVLRPLFFGTLNTPPSKRAPRARGFGRIPFLNGGLFSCGALERRRHTLHFPDEALGLVFGELLARYRFTAREGTTSWSEAAIDPEMLGKAFESLMASRERRTSGAFYTPQSIVASVTRTALTAALAQDGVTEEQVERAMAGELLDEDIRRAIAVRAARIALLDPACGSGAFLVHALEELAALLVRLGATCSPSTVRRALLTRCIFGVDINPTAVWLCELRLWLSVVIESDDDNPLHVTPLPNLDRQIRIGDSLAGLTDGERVPLAPGIRIAAMRERYARATGARKRTLARVLDRAERDRAIASMDAHIVSAVAARRELLVQSRSRDLFDRRQPPDSSARTLLAEIRERLRQLRARRRTLADGGALPFAWSSRFPDVIARGGFDLVIGNPPWVRLHRIPAEDRASLRARYSVFGHAAWQRGAMLAGAGSGFAAQADLSALFVERSVALLASGGTLALLLPTKLWRALAGGGVRRLLAEQTQLLALEDWSESRAAFDAVVYPSVVIARKKDNRSTADQLARVTVPSAQLATPHPAPLIAAALRRREASLRWTIPAHQLPLGGDSAAPWLIVPSDVRVAFDHLQGSGPALAESHLGRPSLGVKCGCNDAFVVSVAGREAGLARVSAGGRQGIVEANLLRPLIRGESVGSDGGEFILWTHSPGGTPLDRLPPHAERWLDPWQRRLRARSDVRGGMRWWSLFRTAAASSTTARVVWADFGRVPRARVIPAGDPAVAINSCYVLCCRDAVDAHALAALLNSPLAAAWLNTLAEPARGGYHRYLAWTVALLPIPRDWTFARSVLAPLGATPEQSRPADLLAAATRAYRLRSADVAPLIEWSNR